MTPYSKDNFSTELEDEVMVANRLQADYQKFLSELQQKGCCDEQDRVKLLEYFDRADGLNRRSNTMVGMTEKFLMIGSPNDMVKQMSTEELIGRTIPSAAVRLSTLPRNSVDAIERTKECLKVVSEELESRGVVPSERLLEVMGLD